MTRTSGSTRREFLRLGLTGLTGLTLPGLARARAAGATAPPGTEGRAVILVWLRGGASHLDTFDPKPYAPSEYRGPFRTLRTNVPGIEITDLLPRLAGMADRYSLLRSIAHTGGGHPAGSLQVLSGDPDAQDKPGPRYPDWMSVVSRLHASASDEMPTHVAVNPIDNYDNFVIAGPTYLGDSYSPFTVMGDPNAPDFAVPNVGLEDPSQQTRLRSRMELRQALDHFRRDLDRSGQMAAMDEFETKAVNLLLSPTAQRAFDLTEEADSVRDEYGRNRWGQQCLMARRLIEAGVEVVTTEFDGPLCGRVANWDDHAVNHHVFDALTHRAPCFDQAVSALIRDVYRRGLDRRVMVIVGGEFGRTPRISYVASSGPGVASAAAGVVQPGRDHWPQANTMLFAGGGIQTGQVIGATDPRGEEVVQRRVGPEDLLATIYHYLGIDYRSIMLKDYSGRPRPIVRNGTAISELIS